MGNLWSFYNICLGGGTARIGAVINESYDDNCKTALVKGIWQGSIGGVINYGSKKTLYLIYKKQNVAHALPAKLLNAAGNSIIENAARYVKEQIKMTKEKTILF